MAVAGSSSSIVSGLWRSWSLERLDDSDGSVGDLSAFRSSAGTKSVTIQ